MKLRMMLVSLALAMTLGGVRADDDVETVRLADDGRPLCNPDMGWVMHYYDNGSKYGTLLTPGDSMEWYPACNVVYLRLPWSWLEPEEGKFNWNAIDTPAQRWIERGGQVAFRITVSETIPDATPKWVADAGAKVIRWNWTKGPSPDGRLWECVPDDPVFLEKYGNFLKALASRYDGRRELAFIDIGSVGIWGEGHTKRTIRLPREETQRIVRIHTDLYLRYFRKSLVVVNDDFTGSREDSWSDAMEYAFNKRLGWRDDSIMVDGPNVGMKFWYHENQARRFYEHAPTILEIGHYHVIKERGNWNGAALLEAIEAHKASYLSVHGDPRVMLDENPELIREAGCRLGYRFQAREVSFPKKVIAGRSPAVARPFRVKFTFANVGVSKCYRDAYPCLTLKIASGGIAAVLTDCDFNLKTLPPTQAGKIECRGHDAEFVLGRWFCPVMPSGEYQAYISVGEANGTPVFELPHGDTDGHRRYRIGSLIVDNLDR